MNTRPSLTTLYYLEHNMADGNSSNTPVCGDIRNPHCAEQWPHSVYSHNVASLIEVSSGASVIARLLHADDKIRDDSEAGAEPFTAYAREGLFNALKVCLGELARRIDHLQGIEDRAARGGAA